MSLDTACFSIYSDMSNRKYSIPIVVASCFATSVFPTPVGPMNKNDPTGRSVAARPALDRFIDVVNVLIASSCPKMTLNIFFGRDSKFALSVEVTLVTGTLAIFATIFSISLGETVFLLPFFSDYSMSFVTC